MKLLDRTNRNQPQGAASEPASNGPRRPSDRTIVRSAFVLGLMCLSLVSFGGFHGSTAAGASGAVPQPASTTSPSSTTSRTATLVASALRMRFAAGTYTGYRFSGSTVVGRKTAALATAATYTISQRTWVSGRMYVRALEGPLSGHWIHTPGHTTSGATSYAAGTKIRLGVGRYTGYRFFDGARLSIGRTMSVSAATDFTVVRRATVQNRVHYYIASGPISGRWIPASTAVKLVTQSISNGTGTGTTASPLPSVKPSVAPSANPTAAPASTATARPTATASVTPTPKTSTAPAPTATAPTTTAAVWKTLVIAYRQTDVTFKKPDGTSYRLRATVSDSDLALALKVVQQTGPTVNSWSNGMARMDMTIVQPTHPVTQVSPLGDVYWLSPAAVKADLDAYAPDGRYDSVIVIWQNWDSAGMTLPTRGWGLTIAPGSWSNGAGYSAILVPPQTWWWNGTVPSEVFVHEWMHQVLFHFMNNGYQLPDLHSPGTYGYTDAGGTWKDWYSAVLQGRVRSGDGYVGLNASIWKSSTPTTD